MAFVEGKGLWYDEVASDGVEEGDVMDHGRCGTFVFLTTGFALVFVVFNRFCSGLREDSFFLSQWLLAFASVPWNMGALGDCFVWLPSISATVLNIEPSSILIEQIKKSERSFVMKVPSLSLHVHCGAFKNANQSKQITFYCSPTHFCTSA